MASWGAKKLCYASGKSTNFVILAHCFDSLILNNSDFFF